MTYPRPNSKISEFINANKNLENADIVRAIGTDKDGIHYYLFFGYKYIQITDETERHKVRDQIQTVV